MRIQPALLQEVRQFCAEEGYTLSEFIRGAMREKLNREKRAQALREQDTRRHQAKQGNVEESIQVDEGASPGVE